MRLFTQGLLNNTNCLVAKKMSFTFDSKRPIGCSVNRLTLLMCIAMALFGVLKVAHAAEIPACTQDLPKGSSCIISIANLKPTQPDVGRREVKIKRDSYRKMSAHEIEKLKFKKTAPVIIGPNGGFYLIDHHHTALALLESHQTEMYVIVSDNWSEPKNKGAIRKKMAGFWRKMKANQYGYFKNEAGQIIDPLSAAFPKTIEATGNNRLRSLAYLLIDQKVIDIADVNYGEFKVAEILHRLGVSVEPGKYDEAVIAAKTALDSEKGQALVSQIETQKCGLLHGLKLVILDSKDKP